MDSNSSNNKIENSIEFNTNTFNEKLSLLPKQQKNEITNSEIKINKKTNSNNNSNSNLNNFGQNNLDCNNKSVNIISNFDDEILDSISYSPVLKGDNIKSNDDRNCLKQKKDYNDYINQICTDNILENLWVNSNNDTKYDQCSISTTTPIEVERPVLHVQFVGDDVTDNLLTKNFTEDSDVKSNQSSESSSSSSSSSSSDDDAYSQYSETRAPDGGWGWVIVFASFMVNLIADGITFSFGVIFVEFLNYFGEGKSKTAWIGSLFMAIPLLSGPIASFLTDRYGCRKVTIIGSILACVGFVLSAFSNSMELLFLTFGVISGFGLSLCYVAAVVIVAYYFEKKRSFATGLSVCGSGIGTFIFAPLTQFLLEQYGWRGTTLILAGVFLNMTIFGLLMRDLEWTTHKAKQKAKQKKEKKIALSADSFSFSTSTNTAGTISNGNQQIMNNMEHLKGDINVDSKLFSSLVTLPTYIKNGEHISPEVLELLSSHKNGQAIILKYPNLAHSRSFSEPYSTEKNVNDNNKNSNLKTETNNINKDSKDSEEIIKFKKNNVQHYREAHNRQHPSAAYLKDLRIHRHSLTYRGAMLNINRYRLRASSCPDIYRNSMTTIAKEKSYWCQGFNEFKNLFLDILDLSYFGDIRFLLFAISNFLLYTWYDVPYVYLTDYAIELGIQETDASILIGIIGIVNMFGEILLGWIGDIKGVSPSVVYAGCMACCGAFTALVPLYKSYTWLCVISGFFGLFIAANYALTSIILVELITIEKFTNAYGLLLLVQGIANLIGPPLAGYFYDVTGSYNLSFYVAGLFIVLSGGILLIVPGLGKYRKYRALKLQNKNDPENAKQRNGLQKNVNHAGGGSNGTKLIKDYFENGLIKKTTDINCV